MFVFVTLFLLLSQCLTNKINVLLRNFLTVVKHFCGLLFSVKMLLNVFEELFASVMVNIKQ